MESNTDGQLWGGRFKSPPSPELVKLSRSIHFDWRLAPYDLIQTLVHAGSLRDAEIITASEYDLLKKVVKDLDTGIRNGKVKYEESDEDVHTAIERLITQELREIGTKLRSGRSRNDQVATDLRLYLRDVNQETVKLTLDLIDTLIQKAKLHADVPAPGFTHLQHAQPITLGHEIAKHAHALVRDCERAIENDTRIAISPLGAGALAGSAFSLDVEKLAKQLEMNKAAGNSIDAISDRDFVAEFLFNVSLIGIHLSQLAEEIILWSSSEFGFAQLDDSWSTGSSLMPQKRNPDIAELSRGKTGRFIGNLVTILTVLKALPFGYNRDLQEDKEALFDSVDQIMLVLPAMNGLVASLSFDTQKISASALVQHSSATDIADYLVKKGLPFKQAHELTGEAVLLAETQGIDVHQLQLSDFQKISALFEADLVNALKLPSILKAKSSDLGTAPISVRKQLDKLESNLRPLETWSNQSLVPKL
ncbi:MAG: argininosuccinate lyase [Actinobacteria bacterium]|nr:argininosuccinate lyase [Actinomycetota bacterium]